MSEVIDIYSGMVPFALDLPQTAEVKEQLQRQEIRALLGQFGEEYMHIEISAGHDSLIKLLTSLLPTPAPVVAPAAAVLASSVPSTIVSSSPSTPATVRPSSTEPITQPQQKFIASLRKTARERGREYLLTRYVNPVDKETARRWIQDMCRELGIETKGRR